MLRFSFTLLTIGLLSVPAMAAPESEGIAFFESKIRPVLVSHCYKCHSDAAATAGKLKGGLNLETRAGLRKGGENGAVILPGKPEESRLIHAVRYTNEDLQMPPKDRLSAEVVANLEKWVAMGAPDPRESAAVVTGPPKRVIDIDAGKKWWAFQPLSHTAPPAVKKADFVRTDVDRFVLAELEQKGIVPNPPASRAVLIRRAYADLVGLPPSPEEVDAFVKDPSADAWPKLIDKLLASDHYGERWARHWLDVVRFAESNGYEFDADRRGAYQYRDFVIRAFNRDMPFDQFVRWQIAGDKLLPGNYDAGAATGFLVAGPSPGQITAKTAEPLRYDQLDDMVSTLGSSMLGLTVGCCRCHDHKFDPLPQRNYYRLISCFADTDATELKLDPKPELFEAADAKWKADHAPLTAAWETFQKEELPNRVAKLAKEGFQLEPAPWVVLDVDRAEVAVSRLPGVEKLLKQPDGSLLLENRAKRNQTFTLVAHTHAKKINGLRIEALANKLLSKSGPGIGKDGEFLLTRIDLLAAPLRGKAKPIDVKLKAIKASAQAKGKELALAVDNDPANGWAPGEAGKNESAVLEFDHPIEITGGAELTLKLSFDSGIPFAQTRIAIATGDSPVELEANSTVQARVEIPALIEEAGGKVTDTNRAEIARWMQTIDAPTAHAYDALQKHLAIEPKENFEAVFAAGMRGGRPVYFLGRGETNKKNGLAPPGFIEVLMNAPERDDRWTVKGDATASASSKPANKPTTRPVEPRVAMAQWITDENGGGQLLARTIVNRLWQHHMGRGIVGTPNDFGVQGDLPTHPELLDFLARQLISNGWHLKPIQKLIMTSSVYMESGDSARESAAIDPENKLCWRHPSQRLEAEAVRDSLLAISGNLQDTMYGPGTLDDASPRRSVYLTVKRSKPVLFMQLFDAPEAMQSIGQRQVTTVATQALTMMNSPLVRLRAEQLAKRVRPKADVSLDAAVEQAYRLALCRRPSDEEKARMLAFIDRQAKTYKANGVDIALADFCQVLLCSDEFVYVD